MITGAGEATLGGNEAGPRPPLSDRPGAGTTTATSARAATWAFVRLTRAENCVLAGVATLVGAGTSPAGIGGATPAALAGAVAAVMLVLAFGNVVNDIADREADGLGKARRPLASGRVSPAHARRLAAGLLAGALGIAAATVPGQLLVVAAMGGVAALYTPFLKRVPLLGNAVFAGQCGATIVFGAQAAGGVQSTTVGAALLVAAGILCVEVAKTVEDDVADRAAGTRTVAHLVAVARQPRLVGAFTAVYLAVGGGLWPTADRPALFALAAAPALPLVAFALVPGDARPPSARVARYVVASKCLWPLTLVALTGL